MADRAPATYAEIAHVLSNLPLLLREARRARSLSMRAASREIGCGFTTIKRTEGGELPNVQTALLILRWLGA